MRVSSFAGGSATLASIARVEQDCGGQTDWRPRTDVEAQGPHEALGWYLGDVA
jgi:hypothetical protein